MTVAVAVAAAKTSTGDQDITTSDLGGDTPKAALFLYSRATADGSITADAGASYGMTDGTNQCAVAMWVKDNATSAVGLAYRVGKTTKCICALKASGAIHSEAQFVTFVPNGVRVNWTTADAAGWLVTVLLFSGSDWPSVACGSSLVSLGGVTNTLGFQPDIVFLIGASGNMSGSVASSSGQTTIGATVFPGGATEAVQYCHDAGIGSRQNAAVPSGPAFGTVWGAYRFAISQYGVILDQQATGFVMRGSTTPPGGHSYGYLALKFAGTGTPAVGAISPSTDLGHQSYNGFGGKPSQFMFLLTQQINLDPAFDWHFGINAITATKSGGFAVGSVSDSQSVGASHPTSHHSVANEDTITMLNDTGTVNIAATLVSFDLDGLTLNFTNVPEGAMQWTYLTILQGGSTARVQAWIED